MSEEIKQLEEKRTEQKQRILAIQRRTKLTCKVCEHPKGMELSEKYLNNEVTLKEAAKEIGCHYQSFRGHMIECCRSAIEKTTEGDELKVDVNSVAILQDKIKRFDARLSMLMDQEPNSREIGDLKDMAMTLKSLIETLNKLTGEISESNVVVNISNEMSLFKQAATQVLLAENPQVWEKIKEKMKQLENEKM